MKTEKELPIPRVTPEQIESVIESEFYFTAYQGARCAALDSIVEKLHLLNPLDPALQYLTFCVLVLKNGFTVTGESACVHPAIFDAEIGKKIARDSAKNKIWQLEGYLLKQQLSQS